MPSLPHESHTDSQVSHEKVFLADLRNGGRAAYGIAARGAIDLPLDMLEQKLSEVGEPDDTTRHVAGMLLCAPTLLALFDAQNGGHKPSRDIISKTILFNHSLREIIQSADTVVLSPEWLIQNITTFTQANVNISPMQLEQLTKELGQKFIGMWHEQTNANFWSAYGIRHRDTDIDEDAAGVDAVLLSTSGQPVNIDVKASPLSVFGGSETVFRINDDGIRHIAHEDRKKPLSASPQNPAFFIGLRGRGTYLTSMDLGRGYVPNRVGAYPFRKDVGNPHNRATAANFQRFLDAAARQSAGRTLGSGVLKNV